MAAKAKQQPILIVGGGLGGAAAALALSRAGWRVQLIEQAPEFGVIGYGIQLGPNVFRMFERLGVRQAVLDKALIPSALLMLDAMDGEPIVRIPTGSNLQTRFGGPYVVIHRVDLHNVLLDACRAERNVEFVPDTSAAAFEQASDGVTVRTASGATLAGAALIGADGLRSTIRQQIHHEGDPRMTGYVAHRTIVPMSEVPAGVHREEVVLWSGDGFHIVHYPLRDHKLFNLVAVFRTDTFAERGDLARYRAEVNHTYRNAHPVMRDLLKLMDFERRWPISDRDPIRHWGEGAVTLLGDAAHPTLQSLAQGAGMAIEDAVCLAEMIEAHEGRFADAFRRYERARYLRTARVQYESRYLWDSFYHLGGIEREVMRSAWSDRTEDDHYRCLAWLYDGFDSTTNTGVAA